jgi:hypothetical protein
MGSGAESEINAKVSRDTESIKEVKGLFYQDAAPNFFYYLETKTQYGYDVFKSGG